MGQKVLLNQMPIAIKDSKIDISSEETTKELAKDLGLSADINRIETFDVSHFSGDSAIASCVVFSKTGPCKKGYRLFNIPKEFSGNDIGSLENV